MTHADPDRCSCTLYAIADHTGSCACATGFIETTDGTCISCNNLHEAGSDRDACTCPSRAVPNGYGVCTCPAGEITTDSGACINCADLTGVGADTASCQCAPYALVNDTGVCQCDTEFIETNENSCIARSKLTGIFQGEGDTADCGTNAHPDVYGVCHCEDNHLEHINGNHCVIMPSELLGPTSETGLECHPYAKINDDSRCECLNNADLETIETEADDDGEAECIPRSSLTGIVANTVPARVRKNFQL